MNCTKFNKRAQLLTYKYNGDIIKTCTVKSVSFPLTKGGFMSRYSKIMALVASIWSVVGCIALMLGAMENKQFDYYSAAVFLIIGACYFRMEAGWKGTEKL